MKRINRFCLKGILLAAVSCLAGMANAQERAVKPFAGDKVVTDRLFNLDDLSINYHFTAELGGGNFAVIEYSHLGDWVDKGELRQAIDIAQRYYRKVQDSFKGAASSKRLDIHIPLEGEPATARIFEYAPPATVLLMKGDMQSPLKVTMDTVRILRTVAERTVYHSKRYVQMQYTFLLKDIDEVMDLTKNPAIISNVEQTFDSVVNEYRDRWSRPNKWTHNLNVTYYPASGDPKQRLDIKRVKTDDDKGKFYQAFEFDGGLGLTFFRNAPCPVIDAAISYKWPTRKGEYVFLRLSNTTFSDFVWRGSTSWSAYGLSFLNIEFGWLKARTQSNIPLYKTAIGFGYLENPGGTPYTDPTVDARMGKLYASFSLSKLFTLTFDEYFMGAADHVFTGVSVIARVW